MAQYARKIKIPKLPIVIALGFILVAVTSGFLPLFWLSLRAGFGGLDAYLPRVISFTLKQAFLSTVLSLLFALPVALAFARRQFPARNMLLKLFSIPLALPAIVAVLGIIGIYGNNGFLHGLISVYGLPGILLAHVFFNMPMAVRLMLTQLEAVPPESFRLGAQLGFTDSQVFRFIEWPQIASSLSGIASLIFLLCAASFAVVLILGGGPQATTLEVAIYQSLRMDFDPARAALLALAQFSICTLLVLIAGRFAQSIAVFPRALGEIRRYHGKSLAARVADALAIFIGCMLILPPILQVILTGITKIQLDHSLLRAIITSLTIGFASASLGLILGWVLAQYTARSRSAVLRSAIRVASLAALIMPPAVLATGWFITLTNFTDVSRLAAVMVIMLNGLMALPFIWPAIYPALVESMQRHDRLCGSLGLKGWDRLRLVDLPVLRKPIGLAFLMGMIVSLGDLSAITLFGSEHLVTLPALIMRQMGHYRMDAAAGTAVVLSVFCFVLISLAQSWSNSRDHA